MTTTLKRFAGALLIGTALTLAPVAAFAQDAAAPAADAAAPAAETAVPAAEAPATPAEDPVLARVGDETITESDLNYAAEDLAQQLGQMPPEQRKAFLVGLLIDMKLMSKAARDAGLDKTDAFQREVQYLEDRTLRREYFSEKIANAVTADVIKTAYDKYVAEFTPVEEVHARHILLATEDEAKAVKAEIEGGTPFEIVAMDKTTDPSGKQNGGDLGFFQKEQMVPEFSAAAFTLEPGKISDPVQSQFGWHIIKVDEKRMSSPETIEQKTQELGQTAMFAAYDAIMADLKSKVTVDIPDPELAKQINQDPAGEDAPAAQ